MKYNRNTSLNFIITSFLTIIIFINMATSVNAQKLTALGTGVFDQIPTEKKQSSPLIYADKGASYGGTVQKLIEYKGELYAVGSFKKAGNIDAANIARWNGSLWSPVGTGLDAVATAVCVYKDELYVAGVFKSAGGVPVKYIAKWDGTKWSAVGEIDTYGINALIVYKGELYAGGSFAEEENIQANLFKWNGKKWVPIKTKHGNDIYALAEYNGELYAGGTFLENENARVMRWNGKVWSDAGVELSGAVSCFAIHNNKLYTGGYFSRINNTPSQFIVYYDGKKWNHNEDGLWGAIPRHWLSTLTEYAGNLYAGGKFQTGEENNLAKNISVLKSNRWSPVIHGFEGSVYTMAVYKNALYIGGNFTIANGTEVSNNIGMIEL
ncbi:hypothetical protein FAM09_19130 [Niastella caeni]|uniref:Galactose oxidase n=1 Tax=Niastella caeni TaxID=2569763 RepID=A0A4S8HNV3_9BACT|nr:hypothetical protein [Niastella caeni]THU37068.1 hypothetical protein FAM09_19130 [Niastella caeni]